jgi:hypothetical protein
MSFGIPLLVCTLAFGPAATAPSGDRAKISDTIDYHVRSSDPLVRAWIKNGGSESPTLNALLGQLIESDVIVHVVLVDRIPGGANGQLYFVTKTPTARYLRIEMTRLGGRADTIALLAHELQHAVEVARAPRVRDAQSLAGLYLQLGDSLRDARHYDSAAARVTEDIVRREVLGRRGAPADELQLAAAQSRQRSLR